MTKFFIETYGCSHNFADSEQMAGLLKEAKFEPVDKLDDADIIIINTCTVKGPTENGFFTRLGELKKEHPYKILVIAGCIPQTDPEKLKDYSIIGTKSIHHIVEVVEEALNDNIVKLLESGEMPPLNLPKIRKNPIIEIIPISRGCLSACSFCKTKAARGNLQSYPVEDIINVARKAVTQGVKEIWLTSQDTFCYGFDIETNLPNLLKEMVKIPGLFKIRVGMGNPIHLMKIKDELLPLLNHEKIFKFIHVPAQSGSNKILKDMKRGNTNEEFLEIVKEIKTIIPEINFATDIIVGYPTETDEDYWETLNLVRKVNPDIINISRFWPRPKTPAAKLKELPGEEVKRRSKIITDIFSNISKMRNERWLNWEGQIIIDEKNTNSNENNSGNQWIGRNQSYKPIIVEGDFKLGDIINIKIIKTGIFDLQGKVVN
ncbi:MAG: tRNA (N(6)-L-threonylcarbamoyladenosine(37)-C(2))-methylthiotransferase [Candidatus Woesearchaeota archaeon]